MPENIHVFYRNAEKTVATPVALARRVGIGDVFSGKTTQNGHGVTLTLNRSYWLVARRIGNILLTLEDAETDMEVLAPAAIMQHPLPICKVEKAESGEHVVIEGCSVKVQSGGKVLRHRGRDYFFSNALYSAQFCGHACPPHSRLVRDGEDLECVFIHNDVTLEMWDGLREFRAGTVIFREAATRGGYTAMPLLAFLEGFVVLKS